MTGAREPSGHEPRAIQRGLRLLEAVAAIGPGATAQEIAEHTGIPRSTAYKVLNLLVADGYLVRITDLSGFALGVRTQQLAAPPRVPLAAQNDTVLERLRSTVRYGVFLAGFSGDRLRLIDVDPDHELPGAAAMRQYPHASAIGKIMLAAADAPSGHRLRQLTPHTIVEPATLDAHLARVRDTGIATEIDESRTGRSGLAAVVLDADRRVTGALAIIGRTGRIPVTDPSLIRLVQDHAADLCI